MAGGKDKSGQETWTIVAAFLFLGIGIGWLFDQVSAGTLIGIALGFLVTFYIKSRKK